MKKSFLIGFGAAGLVLQGFFALPAAAQTYTVPSYPYYQSTGYTQPFASPTACPNLSYNLTLGSTDYYTQGQVTALQRYLAARYYGSQQVTGYYGTQTVANVQRLQQELGVYPPTGGVGPLTRAAIARTCGSGYPYPYPYPGQQTTFTLGKSFTLSAGESAHERQGRLDITLTRINTSASYLYSGYYWGNQDPVSVTITLGQSCPQGAYCTAIYYPQQSFTLEEDDEIEFMGYTVELTSLKSQSATFRIDDDGRNNDHDNDDDASIDVTAPKSGTEVDQGDELRIAWSTDDAPQNSSVVLDLYTQSGNRVGTIAVSSRQSGSYTWDVPVRSTYCTLQYPNGLCGMDLEGKYYVKASLVRGNGLDGGTVLDSDSSSTFSIED